MPEASVNFDDLRQKVAGMALDLQLHEPGTVPGPIAAEPTFAARRASRRPGARRDILTLSLVERGGLVFWELGTPVPPELRRSRRAAIFSGTLIARKEARILGLNEVVSYLQSIDTSLTPDRGLQQWTPKGLLPNAQPAQTGKILLFVHGTFSKSAHLFDEILQAPGGPEFLNRASQPAAYNQILAFDHPTLSASPIVNALDLRTAFASSQADVDIVCHSRGGLVSRWWMEVLDSFPARKKRAVFVGSPLTGTSLAAPDRLRDGLKLLSTYASLLGSAAMAAPLLNAPRRSWSSSLP